ncbi:unnamed protein product [Linum tenue]|uniref:Uncharacterized protein n=1 Tax=Linum tenue TaxID=586396 RepID=A0AAV0M641_9ROSI|nr:unnamed protein product [Linum tenue]CAI0441514.1 unnamed protein product [Linum tenue]
MFNVWTWFQYCLAVHPLKTEVISSGLIWGAGDIAAQAINNYTAAADKPLVFQYQGLDRFMRSQLFHPNSLRFVGVKVAIDGFIFGPLDLLLFFTYMGIAAGKSVPQIRDDMKRDFLPAFMFEGGIWPIIQVVNFRFVPVKYQLLYVNFFCLIDSCFLSWLEQQRNAPWKAWVNSLVPFQGEKG